MESHHYFTVAFASGLITLFLGAIGAYDKYLDVRKKRLEVKKQEDEYNKSKRRRK